METTEGGPCEHILEDVILALKKTRILLCHWILTVMIP